MKKILLVIVLLFSFQNFAQNNAFTFNGIDQQIATYTQQTQINFTTGDFTMEAWVKPAAFVAGNNSFEHTILGNDIWDETNNTGYVLRTGGSRKLDFTFGNGNIWYSVVSTNPVFTADEWTHVAIVRSGTTFTLYADGQQVGQQTFTQNLVQANGNLRIGENGNGSGRFFNGAMDEVKFWNVARTQAQVQDDLNATDMTTPPTDLKVYYKMNQTTGQDVISETAYDLFAKYLPTVAVNSTIGFFRTYTFIGGSPSINWTIPTNWKNNFIPPDNQNQNDIINITADCKLDISTLTIPNGATLNILTSGILSTNPYDSSNITINNYGILNIENKLIISRDTHSLYNYGTININPFGAIEANTTNVYFKTGSMCNNYGSIIKSPTYTFATYLTIETGAILTNFNGATIDSTRVENNGTIENNGLITVFIYTTNNSSSVLTNSLAGIFRMKNALFNKGLILNYGTINLDKDVLPSGYTYKNESTGIINNIGQQSNFLINNSFVKFQNLGTLTSETPITNKGDFLNDTSGTFKLNGNFSSFENIAGATFTNSGTFITKNSVDNIGTYNNNNLHTGNANFNSSIFVNNTNGIIAPSTDAGVGIGSLSFLNGLTNNGKVNIEIGGTNASNTFDVVNVTGTATLGGILNITLFNNYQPTFGTQNYTILIATSCTGTFATVNFPVLSGTNWSISYNSNSVIITASTPNVTTISACDSYTWTNNNLTYTASGVYQGNSIDGIPQSLNLTITPFIEPLFNEIAPICNGETLILPTASLNGITGTWFPAINNQATTTYFFTPTGDVCAYSILKTIVVYELPTVSAGNPPTAVCVGTNITLTGTSTVLSTGFTGNFAPANWTLTNNNADGSVNTINAPNAIDLTSGDNGSNNNGTTNFSTTTTNNGTITFNWSYNTNDSAELDYPNVIVNGVTSILNGYDIFGTTAQSGTMTIPVVAGQTFAFNMFTTDNIFGAATVTISNFVFSSGSVNWSTLDGTLVGATNELSATVSSAGTYTLTATGLGGCSASSTVVVSYITPTTPTFTQVAPICSGLTLTALPTTSLNGITGSWLPTLNNLQTTEYTFTPSSGSCVTNTTMTIVVTPNSENTTTISNCGSYTWANNNQTYTQSGIYTGTTTNCVTEKLDLTIINNDLPPIISAYSCGPGSITFTSNAIGTVNWYNAETGGTLLATGQTFTIPPSSPQVFYYEVVNGSCTTPRQLAIASEYVIPEIVSTTPASRCDAGSLTLQATSNGTAIYWYDAPTGGNLISTNNNYVTPILTTTTSYYAEAVASTVCNPSARVAVIASIIPTNAPTATSNQTFCSGEIVNNIAVTGTNIIWYDAITNGNIVASSTPILAGMTYYASQTVNGCESQNRVAVTMSDGTCLGNESFDTTNFSYYPNPTYDKVTISYSKTIDSIEVTSVLGQRIFTKKCSSSLEQIDLSGLPTATYFVKVQADNNQKTIKIIRQ